jgi:hypothetical protein
MSDKNDSYSTRRVPFDEVTRSEDKWQDGHDGYEWHLDFPHSPDYPYPFPIVPAGTYDKHDAVGHLSNDGSVHVFNSGIIEKLVRAGLGGNWNQIRMWERRVNRLAPPKAIPERRIPKLVSVLMFVAKGQVAPEISDTSREIG